MKKEYLEFLKCLHCDADLRLHADVTNGEKVESGELSCSSCDNKYPIKNYVPRFVNYTTYADSFGPQWKTFAKSQLDTDTYNESEIRFESELGWTASDLEGKTIIEMGSGAGRFIDIASRRNARLAIGVDITDAVEASQDNLGDRDNVFFIQADVFDLPLKQSYFDFAYSIGVLHHTPDPNDAFNEMVKVVKENGKVGVSLYEMSLYPRPNRHTFKVVTVELLWSLNMWRCECFRFFTTKIPDKLMLLYCKTVIPVLHYLNKVPVLRFVRYLVPSTCYRHLPVVCSMVDTMDTYSTKIVHSYRGKDVFQWFLRLGLKNIMLLNSRAGWVSVVADKGTAEEREKLKLDLRQPKPPGKSGYVEN
jgi:ubiquinone/menaquinone biosynthesis C-methylase UbiE/uncharacterized protein YbaR (Trm112 family)